MVCATTNTDMTKCLSSLLTEEPLEFYNELQLHTASIQAVHTSPYSLVDDGLLADFDEDVRPMATNKQKLYEISAKERESILTPKILDKRWGISVERAQQTNKADTHEDIRNVFLPSERKVQKKAPWMIFLSIKGNFYTDKFFSKRNHYIILLGALFIKKRPVLPVD
jgi:hypothetical protein